MTTGGYETGATTYDGGKTYNITNDEISFTNSNLDDSKREYDQFTDVAYVNHELSRLCNCTDSDTLKIQKLTKIT